MNINYLKEVMIEKNIGIAELAKKAKIGQSTVSEILNEVRKDVRLSTANKLAEALDIKIEYLCKEE